MKTCKRLRNGSSCNHGTLRVVLVDRATLLQPRHARPPAQGAATQVTRCGRQGAMTWLPRNLRDEHALGAVSSRSANGTGESDCERCNRLIRSRHQGAPGWAVSRYASGRARACVSHARAKSVSGCCKHGSFMPALGHQGPRRSDRAHSDRLGRIGRRDRTDCRCTSVTSSRDLELRPTTLARTPAGREPAHADHDRQEVRLNALFAAKQGADDVEVAADRHRKRADDVVGSRGTLSDLHLHCGVLVDLLRVGYRV